MAFDDSGNLWMLLCDKGDGDNFSNFRLKKLDANLTVVDSVILPPSILSGTQGLTFDPAGNAWVSALFGDNSDRPNNWYFSLYKVNATGSPIIDSVSYQSSYRYMDYAAKIVSDAAGNIWSTGLIMMDTTGMDSGTDPLFQFALWKYSNQADLAPGFPKYYNHSNHDGSFATAIDANGNIYGIGVSRNESSKYDLALWKYDATGTAVSGFPKFVPNWSDKLGEPEEPLLFMVMQYGRQRKKRMQV